MFSTLDNDPRQAFHRHHRAYRGRSHGPIFLGGVLLLVGGAHLLDQLGYLGGLHPWQLWPTLVIWSGVLHVLGLRHHSNRLWGVVVIAAGALFQAHYLGVPLLGLHVVWPLALMLLGVYVLFRGSRPRKGHMDCGEVLSDEHTLNRRLVFAGRKERIESKTFRGGKVECTAAGMELDLTDAEIEGEEATIDLDLTMGGIELRVPRHWKVVNDVTPVMGGIEDRTRFNDALQTAKRLRLVGRLFMGGVEIKN
ncbi:MAG: LiaF transmembrane domain-containing protein [Myxococcota bacterium]